MTTQAVAATATAIVSPTGASALFDTLFAAVKAQVGTLAATAEADLAALFTSAKATVVTSLVVGAPALETEIGVLKTAVELAANVFTTAAMTKVGAVALSPLAVATENDVIDATAATMQASVVAWAAAHKST